MYKNLLLFSLLVFCCHRSEGLNYNDLEMLGKTCPGRDSCTRSIEENFHERNCECDSACKEYGDCCIDGPHPSNNGRASPQVAQQSTVYRCLTDRSSRRTSGVYAISNCRSNRTVSTFIRNNCESSRDNISDPILAAPATDPHNRKTYRNLYCAECNAAHANHLRSWKILYRCDLQRSGEVTHDYIRNNLVYSEAEKSWGVYYKRDTETVTTFHKCKLGFGFPREVIERPGRMCRPKLISTCATNYNRRNVIEKCNAYTAAVYRNAVVYKNPHCAICNHVNLKEINCSSESPSGLAVNERSAMSFTLLLDSNSSNGSCVGQTDDRCRCGNDQEWDPFFKKCRTFSCSLPGFAMVNGRCVRQ